MWVTTSFVLLAAWLWLYQGAISLDDGYLIWVLHFYLLVYPQHPWISLIALLKAGQRGSDV